MSSSPQNYDTGSSPVEHFSSSLIQNHVHQNETPSRLSMSTEIANAELAALQNYQQQQYNFGSEPVIDPSDGTPLLDHNLVPISVAKMLATKPLKRDLCTRPGPGNRQLTYMSGDSVTRTLNDVFGFDGWCLEVKNSNREVRLQTYSFFQNVSK